MYFTYSRLEADINGLQSSAALYGDSLLSHKLRNSLVYIRWSSGHDINMTNDLKIILIHLPIVHYGK